MATKSIRLGSVLTFDTDKEQDLITAANKLNQTHRMGEFMSHIFRLAMDNPELIKTESGELKYGRLMDAMSRVGMSPERYKFFKGINEELKLVKDRVDSVYNMAFDMYSLARLGKRLGLEGKAANLLSASFIVEKQSRELSDILGTPLDVFDSNKILEVSNKSDKVLEYILETYESLLGELSSDNSSKDANKEEIEEYVRKINKANEDIRQLYIEKEEVLSRNTELESMKSRLEQQVLSVEASIRLQYESKLAEKDAEISRLRAENYRLQSEYPSVVIPSAVQNSPGTVAKETNVVVNKKSGFEVSNGVSDDNTEIDFGSVADTNALLHFFN